MSSSNKSGLNFKDQIRDYLEFFEENRDKISSFLMKYFEIESLLSTKFPCVKRKPSSRKSEIETSKIKNRFDWDYELVNRVFYGKEGTIPKTCRLLRNSVVHSHKNRLSAFREIVGRYDSLMTDMNNLEELIIKEK